MKDGMENKLKFKKLQRRLRLPLWKAIGLLETLWKVTRDNTPEGDIGRLSNEDIAAAIEWEGDADYLVESLVTLGWLDEDSEFRLVVHDWSDHVPNWLKGNFAKHNKTFADLVAKQRAKQPKKGGKSPALEAATKSSVVKSSEAKPKDGDAALQAALPDSLSSIADLWGEWIRWRRVEKRKPITPTSGKMQLKRLAEIGPERARAALEHTISNGWQGIREPDQPNNNGQSETRKNIWD